MMNNILVGLSGGVDSAVAAFLLKEQGYSVTAGFMINYLDETNSHCPTREDMKIAKEVARYLEIPFFPFDYQAEYATRVLEYMYEGYNKGVTPNPDVMCNTEVKFKAFLDEASALGYDKIATGHYAQIQKHGSYFSLLKGKDSSKDQSYFLSGLSQYQLSKALFPIGGFTKQEVREIAKKAGLPNADRKDSQGLCFVGKVNIKDFLSQKIPHKPGNIIDEYGKIIGTHQGVYYYTIGQRKGLHLGGSGEPLFVIKKNIELNEIIVGPESSLDLYADTLTLTGLHCIVAPELGSIEKGIFCTAKIRYRQEDQKCRLIREDDKYKVYFEKKQRAIASGQMCVFYIGDQLIASGVIE